MAIILNDSLLKKQYALGHAEQCKTQYRNMEKTCSRKAVKTQAQAQKKTNLITIMKSLPDDTETCRFLVICKHVMQLLEPNKWKFETLQPTAVDCPTDRHNDAHLTTT